MAAYPVEGNGTGVEDLSVEEWMEGVNDPTVVEFDESTLPPLDENWELFPTDRFLAERVTVPRRSRPRDSFVETREFHGWTLDKLSILQLYFKRYRRVAGWGTYIDAFAGTGLIRVKPANGAQPDGDDVHRLGSASIAVESGAFRDLYLFERPRNSKLLRKHLDAKYTKQAHRCRVEGGDVNQLLPALLARGEVDTSKPCFAFLDPNSTDLDWATIAELASYKVHDPDSRQCKVEMWILFNLQQALQRLWPKRRRPEDFPAHAGTLDRVMGSRAAWVDLWDEGAKANALTRRYVDKLRDELHYRWVESQLINDPATGAPQYYMIHASDHEAAVSFMRWAKTAYSRQQSRDEPIPGLS